MRPRRRRLAVASGRTIKAAFVYTGPINDHGWTNAHDDGRKALEQALGSQVETAFTENVPETADSQRVFEDYARKGFDVIYGTSFGFMDYMLEAAKAFPNVKFDHSSGFKTAPNMSTYFAAQEEPRYVSGIIAGKMTKIEHAGVRRLVSDPRGRALLERLGRGHPDRSIRTRRSTWCGSTRGSIRPRRKSAAESLLDLNADVLTGHATRRRWRRRPRRAAGTRSASTTTSRRMRPRRS